MSADLHIHVLTDSFTEEHYRAFNSNTLGSAYFSLNSSKAFEKEHGCDLYSLCAETPQIWVGEVSWLKAALLDDSETFVPDPIGEICDIIGEDFPTIDDDLIEKISKALKIENKTEYTLANGENVIDFLNKHRGRKTFTISW